jgi:hypothetical protein
MTATDRWQVDLNCPTCRASGNADVFQYDGWSFSSDSRTHVSSVTAGFQIEASTDKRKNAKIFCEKCGIQVF